MSVLQNLDRRAFEHYDVQVLAQSNYFLYTPLLPSLVVGTVEPRSIIDPVRPVVQKKLRRLPVGSKLEFTEAQVSKIDPRKKTLTCRDAGPLTMGDFEVPYDKLVLAAGATTNTFGTPGADKHCRFLKTIGDGLSMRAEMVDLLETACVPGLSEEAMRG